MVKASAILLTCLATATLLAGCSGNRQAQTAPTLTAADNAGGPWFCQPASVTGEWECDNDPARVANPVPDRKPQNEAPDLMPPPLPDQVLAPGSSAQQPAVAGTAAPTAPAAAAPLVIAPASAPTSAEIPEYQRLAYQPDGPTSLLELPPNYYAVQLTAISTAADLERFFQDNGLTGLTAAQIERDGELLYVLLLGIYENFALAERAATDLPAPLDQFEPWIRRLGTLQAAMQRAEQRLNQDQGPG
ncbi:MAG: SPOR domain-containing protein [Pseudomonadales bacterium]